MLNCIQFPHEYAKIKNIFKKIKVTPFAIRMVLELGKMVVIF
jgi:hypothetical protein